MKTFKKKEKIVLGVLAAVTAAVITYQLIQDKKVRNVK